MKKYDFRKQSMSSQFALANRPTGILFAVMYLPRIDAVEFSVGRQLTAYHARRNAHERANFQGGPMAFCVTCQTRQLHLIRLAECLDQPQRVQRVHEAGPAIQFR